MSHTAMTDTTVSIDEMTAVYTAICRARLNFYRTVAAETSTHAKTSAWCSRVRSIIALMGEERGEALLLKMLMIDSLEMYCPKSQAAIDTITLTLDPQVVQSVAGHQQSTPAI